MEKQNIGKIEDLKTKPSLKGKIESGDVRPVKWVLERKNVWRIVYAD